MIYFGFCYPYNEYDSCAFRFYTEINKEFDESTIFTDYINEREWESGKVKYNKCNKLYLLFIEKLIVIETLTKEFRLKS